MKVLRPELTAKTALILGLLVALGAALYFERSASSPTQGKMAVCAICGPRDNAGPEPVRATTQHDGKTYAFCGHGCKAEFERNPALFTATQ